jgi:hypothetical protein
MGATGSVPGTRAPQAKASSHGFRVYGTRGTQTPAGSGRRFAFDLSKSLKAHDGGRGRKPRVFADVTVGPPGVRGMRMHGRSVVAEDGHRALFQHGVGHRADEDVS